MAYYWPQYGIAIEVDDDPHLLPFDEEAFPDTAVYHVTTDVICDPESFSALAHHIAHIHDIELPPDFDELVYSRRLMLRMLFGADLCAHLYRQGCRMSAKKPLHFAGLSRRKKLIVACLAIVCALVAVGLYAWQSQPVPEAGASVTTAEGKTRQEIQDELDAIVRDNMMTISVAPVAQLQEDGKLRVNVQNVQDNKFPQRFRVIQNDETMYESGVVETGKTIETCPAGDIKEGEAYIEIQALDAKTLDSHGNPTRVKVRVEQAEN